LGVKEKRKRPRSPALIGLGGGGTDLFTKKEDQIEAKNKENWELTKELFLLHSNVGYQPNDATRRGEIPAPYSLKRKHRTSDRQCGEEGCKKVHTEKMGPP